MTCFNFLVAPVSCSPPDAPGHGQSHSWSSGEEPATYETQVTWVILQVHPTYHHIMPKRNHTLICPLPSFDDYYVSFSEDRAISHITAVTRGQHRSVTRNEILTKKWNPAVQAGNNLHFSNIVHFNYGQTASSERFGLSLKSCSTRVAHKSLRVLPMISCKAKSSAAFLDRRWQWRNFTQVCTNFLNPPYLRNDLNKDMLHSEERATRFALRPLRVTVCYPSAVKDLFVAPANEGERGPRNCRAQKYGLRLL